MPFLITGGLGQAGVDPSSAFLSEGIQALDGQLVVQLNAPAVISGPAARADGYTITGGGVTVSVTAVEVVDDTVVLAVSKQTYLADYVLHMPELGLVSDDGRAYNGDFELDFAGAFATPPEVQIARSVDARTFEVVFTRAVVQADAETAANYSISPTLTVISASKVTDFTYRITTSRQTQDQQYDVTISNIGGL